jgi:hypothetical protein
MDNTSIPVVPKISDPSLLDKRPKSKQKFRIEKNEPKSTDFDKEYLGSGGINDDENYENYEKLIQNNKLRYQPPISNTSKNQKNAGEELPSLNQEKTFLGVNKKVFVILVVVLLVLLIVAIIYYYFFYKKDDNNLTPGDNNGNVGNTRQQKFFNGGAMGAGMIQQKNLKVNAPQHYNPKNMQVKNFTADPNLNNKQMMESAAEVNIHENNVSNVSVDELDKIIKNTPVYNENKIRSNDEIKTEKRDGVKILSSKIISEEKPDEDNFTTTIVDRLKQENDEFINDEIRKVMNNNFNTSNDERLATVSRSTGGDDKNNFKLIDENDEFEKAMNEKINEQNSLLQYQENENIINAKDEHLEIENVSHENHQVEIEDQRGGNQEDRHEGGEIHVPKVNVICGAINKSNGKVCERRPAAGSTHCQWHKNRAV